MLHGGDAGEFGCRDAGGLAGGRQRQLAPPRHGGGEPHEVVVVRHVADAVAAVRRDVLQDRVVRVRRVDVAVDRVRVAAYPDVDVAGHVRDVAGTGHERRQSFGARHGAVRLRLLHAVDEQVAGAGVAGVAREHRFQPPDRDAHVGPGLVVREPVVPRTQVHDGIGPEHDRVVIGGVAGRQLGHRPRVRTVARRALRGRRRRVPVRERTDVRALLFAGAVDERERPRNRFLRLGAGGLVHRGIDVRPARQRRAPPADGAPGIQARRLLERTDRLRMVERVRETEALIEILLRERNARRNLVVVIAQAFIERNLPLLLGGGNERDRENCDLERH